MKHIEFRVKIFENEQDDIEAIAEDIKDVIYGFEPTSAVSDVTYEIKEDEKDDKP